MFWKLKLQGHEDHTRLRWVFILTFGLSCSNPMQPLRYKSVCLQFWCFRLEEAVIPHLFLWQLNCSSPAEWSRCVSARLRLTFWSKGPVMALKGLKTMCVEPQPHYCSCYFACCWPSDTISQRNLMCRVGRVCLKFCPLLFCSMFLTYIHHFWTDECEREGFKMVSSPIMWCFAFLSFVIDYAIYILGKQCSRM